MSSPEHDMYTTMSVATLGSSTIEEGPKKQYVHSPSKVFNEEKRPKSYFNKPDFFSTADISGAQPKRTHQRKELSDPLRVSDIDGASGQIKDRFLHTKRRVDPLQPTYQLPSCKVVPPEDPKFLRDNLNVDDIPGTRSTTKIVYQPRDNLKLDDIEGSSAGWKPRHRYVFGINCNVHNEFDHDQPFLTEKLKLETSCTHNMPRRLNFRIEPLVYQIV